MRKIDPPSINDAFLLRALTSSRSDHAAAILHRENSIIDRYELYLANNGDPWVVMEDVSFNSIKDSLKSLYNSPPTVLSFIESLRVGIDGACPVCGRSALGTLDHYLPKSSYSEYSFYSKNLVPACDRCNNKRGDLVRGDSPHERPLHPYFDGVAVNRILSVKFEGDLRAPRITPIAVGVVGTNLLTVKWHIENVLVPAGALEYFDSMWGVLLSDKRDILFDLSSLKAIRDSVAWVERYEAKKNKSLNCWDSAFYHGIKMDNSVLKFLLSH